MKVEIDRQSGFCGGVIRAIGAAEDFLKDADHKLYSLGAIVHNEEELSRLKAQGLIAVSLEELKAIKEEGTKTVLIRAHGEPPLVYTLVRDLGFEIVDCTCPVVLKLQKDIREAGQRLAVEGGQIVIFGKVGHPEVLGLVGQVDGIASVDEAASVGGLGVWVVEDIGQLRDLVESGRLRTDRDIELFSQTTKSPAGYVQLHSYLKSVMKEGSLVVHYTICSQVATRYRDLSDFARNHDIIIFVSGHTSSNGKVLCDLCKSVNIRTYHISSLEELQKAWFRSDDQVGVCGATSTPKWLLENVAAAIENLH